MLAILETGAAYCVLDVDAPLSRIYMVLQQLEIDVVVGTGELKEIRVIDVGKVDNDVEDSTFVTQYKNEDSDLAYVCFTSGSTGTPKGVCVEHGNVMAFLNGAIRDLGLNAGCMLAHSVKCTFDVSVFNIFGALVSGGCLVQMDQLMHIFEPINQNTKNFTHLFLTSAVFNSLGQADLNSYVPE
uniref:AMP-dependent synthetase/ligase domain-containing protein n=1 Tax=Ditylenchus dipsaci TaxID=166011 RepID=A0A915DW46_9BILA